MYLFWNNKYVPCFSIFLSWGVCLCCFWQKSGQSQPVDPRIVAQLNLLRRRSLCSCRLASCRALWILNCTTSSEFRRLRLKMNLKRYVNATVKWMYWSSNKIEKRGREVTRANVAYKQANGCLASLASKMSWITTGYITGLLNII